VDVIIDLPSINVKLGAANLFAAVLLFPALSRTPASGGRPCMVPRPGAGPLLF